MADFELSAISRKELTGVHESLVAVVVRAIEVTVQEFQVHDGRRTLAEQKKLVSAGASQTLDSRHITGHAVDLVPLINDKLRWEWQPIYRIADAVRTAAREIGVPIRWGGAWDINFTDSIDATEDLVMDYAQRRRRSGKRVFLDGPHFELPRGEFP